MGKLGKLVVFAIILSLILGSFYYFNLSKSKEAEAKKSSLQVDQFLIKVLIREGSNLTAPLKVMNVGDKGLNVKAEAKNLGFLHISQPEFYLDYGQSIDLNLMFGTKRGAVAQEPGIYVGKLALISDEERKEVPIIVGVESGEILFSMNMNIPTESRRLAKGAHGFVTVTVYNLKKVGPAKVLMSYFISDTSGNKIITESESIVVEDKTTFTKTITAPENIIEGDYIFAAIAKYGSSTGVATSSFEVAGAPEDKLNFIEECSSKPYCLTLSVVVFIIIVSTLQYIYFTLELTRLIKPRLAKQKAKKKKRLLRLEEKKRKLEEKREGKALRKEEEAKVQKELEAMQIKEERKRAEEEIIQREQEKQEKVLERKRLAKVRKRRIKEFLHKLGLYKTEEDKKQKEKERQEKLKKEEEAKKQKGLERQGAEEERLKRTAELKRRKEIGAKRRGEERQKRILKREKLLKSRKKQIKEFLHKLGLYKTEEEKRQIALQRERGKQERLRKEAEIRKQQELERKRAEEERKRKEEELRKQRELEEKQRQEEELKKQAEKVKKRQEELRKQEELRRQEELEKKKREIERQRQEQIKAKKLEQIKQAEVNINSNKEMVKLLNSKLSRMISEKKPLLSSISEIDAKLRLIADEIVGKSKRFEELSMQKSFIIEAHKKQVDELYKKQQSEKAANESKIKDLKEGFAAKRDALIKDLEEELSKLTQSKREVTGKWKRLELKAKLKIEEQTLEEESKKYESRAGDEGKRPEGDYKKAFEEINKKQGELKQGISDLEGQKGQILREKGKISEDVQNKGSKIQKIRLRLENAAKEHAFLRSEWSKLKSELPRLNLDFFANVLSEFKDKAQNKLKGRKQKEQQRLAEERKKQLEAKKGNLEEEGRKQKEKEKEEKLRKEEGAKEQKELERRRYAIELKNQKELETKKRIEDERIKDEENKRKLEIKEKLAKERKKKFSEFFHKIGLYKTPEEKKQAALLKEKQRQEKRRLEQEDFRKKEEGKKQKEKEKEEKLRKEEEAKKQKGLERRRAEEHNKIEELEKEVKELERQRDEKRNLQEVEKEVPEKKTKWFEGLFKKKKAELEEAKEEAGEEPEEAEEGGVDKSENLGEFYKLLNGIKQAINGKDISKAKKLYKEAWEIYASLKYEEQKEVYGKFMKSYNQLSKK